MENNKTNESDDNDENCNVNHLFGINKIIDIYKNDIDKYNVTVLINGKSQYFEVDSGLLIH